MKTLCVYVTHEYSLNLDFFIEHGIYRDSDIDYFIVLNNPTMQLEVPGVTVINRTNKNKDFGGWSQILLTDNRYKNYDYFILLNSTVRGPFLPVWHTDKNWLKLFTDKLNDEIKLVGTTIGWANYPPHVQSMVLALDKIGMNIAVEEKIFVIDEEHQNYFQLVEQKEIRLSQSILDRGYNIACMLKALQGVDFRKNRKPNEHMFFWRSTYFGIDVHPYEVIFSKVTATGIGSRETIPAVVHLTSWSKNSQLLDYKRFDWISYILAHQDLWNQNFRTKAAAYDHFVHRGIKEGRLPYNTHIEGYYYLIDLSDYHPPPYHHGLFNQLLILVNGIIIGHYTGRYIGVSNFYPDYNSKTAYPINKVIDINRLNVLLVELGLRTQVGINDLNYDTKDSKYKNKIPYTNYHQPLYLQWLHEVNQEKEPRLNLGNAFSFIFEKSMDRDLQNLYRTLLINIPFVKEITQTVTAIKKSLRLVNYHSMHLRLEDDIVNYLETVNPEGKNWSQNLYQKYKNYMTKTLTKDDQIFTATNLGKISNRYNFALEELKQQYPNIITSLGWRQQHPTFPPGREFDAIIDYLICRETKSFIGFGGSTFSATIMFHCLEHRIPFIDCDNTYKVLDQDSYSITHYNVGYGDIGLHGLLGYRSIYNGNSTDIVPIHREEQNSAIISAHAPSTIELTTQTPLYIRGYCSPTAEKPPTMTFICDDVSIGTIDHKGVKTCPIKISPGNHVLKIMTSAPEWAHSVWLISLNI